MREVTEKREGIHLELLAATHIVVRADKLNPSHQRFVAAHRILDERCAHREIPSLLQAANRPWVDISSIVHYHPALNAVQRERQLHTPILATVRPPLRGVTFVWDEVQVAANSATWCWWARAASLAVGRLIQRLPFAVAHVDDALGAVDDGADGRVVST